MSDIRNNCPLPCGSKTDKHKGCWDKSCEKYLAYYQGRTEVIEQAIEMLARLVIGGVISSNEYDLMVAELSNTPGREKSE